MGITEILWLNGFFIIILNIFQVFFNIRSDDSVVMKNI